MQDVTDADLPLNHYDKDSECCFEFLDVRANALPLFCSVSMVVNLNSPNITALN